MNRRALLIAASLAALLAACGQHPAPPETPATDAAADAPRPLRRIRFLLNSGFSGANAWFLLADERGYFRREGIEVEFTPGRGAFTAAGRMVGEGFDVGYGDIQAVYEQAATVPGKSPVGVYMMMDRSPSVIILPAQSPIRSAEQLKGRTITGHATDVALNTFAQYAQVAGVDAASVHIGTNEGNWKELLALLDSGKSDALFGYLSTSSAAVRTAGQDVGARLRFLRYSEMLPDFYGSAVMVSPKLLREEPELARGLVRAINQGVIDTLCDPDAAIQALVKRDPRQNPVVERGRLRDTMVEDMGGVDMINRGVGDVERPRVLAALKLTAEARKLSRTPTVEEVFERGLLPPLEERQPCPVHLR